MKKYELIKDNLSIKTEVYYNKGGMNYFSGRTQERGYYLSVSPIEREERGNVIIESFTAYSGVKMLILPVKRQSDKAYQQAVELAKEKEPALRQRILEQIV